MHTGTTGVVERLQATEQGWRIALPLPPSSSCSSGLEGINLQHSITFIFILTELQGTKYFKRKSCLYFNKIWLLRFNIFLV